MNLNWKVLLALGLIGWVVVSSQTALITVVVVLGALFYISYTNEHNWIHRFRPAEASAQDQDTRPIAAVDDGTDSEGRALRSHDYRADK
jgi:hypothetical protein